MVAGPIEVAAGKMFSPSSRRSEAMRNELQLALAALCR